jgi:hypothetical protein
MRSNISRISFGAAWLVALALSLVACQRDGFECSNDAECFDGEVCSTGRCQAGCVPETDGELCASTGECGDTIAFTDRCGDTRELVCPCSNNGNNFCEPSEASLLCSGAGATCGELAVADDGCGMSTTVQCGMCAPEQFCVDNTCSDCPPLTCPATGTTCGVARNACGDELECGDPCPTGQICADNLCQGPVLSAPEAQSGDRFGEEIRFSEGLVAVGAPGAVVSGVESAGVIHVWERSGTELRYIQRITAETPAASEGFGRTFDLRGSRLVVASSGGLRTYELRDATFEQVGTVPLVRGVRDIALGPFDRVYVGYEEVTSGEPTLFVGSCGDNGCDLGEGWHPEPLDPDAFGLGWAIVATDEVIFASAPFDDIDQAGDPAPAGSIYSLADSNFTGGWRQTSWIGGPEYYLPRNYRDVAANAFAEGYGRALDFEETGLAVVGAPFDTPSISFFEAGSFYLYSASSLSKWSRSEKVSSPADSYGARCGHAVAIADQSAFVACVNDSRRDDPNIEPLERIQTNGRIFRFDYSDLFAEWEAGGQLSATNSQVFDHFGWTLEGGDDLLLVGAPGRNEDRGEVWFYEVSTP